MTRFEQLRHLRRFSSTVDAFLRLHLMRTGLELGLFDALRTPQREAQLADRLGLARDLVAGWLEAAEAHGLLQREHHPTDAFRIAPFARWLLDAPESPILATLLEHATETYGSALRTLPELMRGGERRTFGEPDEARRAAALSRFVEERALSALLRIGGVEDARRVLDVGCGHGSYLAGLLARARDARGVGVELDPAVAEEARTHLRERGVERRAEILVGDFMQLDLPRGTFDLILLNNNLYYFPPDQHDPLFRRALSRLAPKGILAIQFPVPSRGFVARAAGLSASTATFDLVLRCFSNLHGLPVPAAVREELGAAGFADTGEVSVMPGGTAVYVWGRAPAGDRQ